MNKILLVVDMQNDFIDGVLGTPEAQAIVPKVAEKIRNFDGDVYFTMDTHEDDYAQTWEGRNLPILHCQKGTYGWLLNDEIYKVVREKEARMILKDTFGCAWLYTFFAPLLPQYIEVIGLCTDICVIANVMICQSDWKSAEIVVDASCCAGSSPELHEAALKVMKSCQIKIIEGDSK